MLHSIILILLLLQYAAAQGCEPNPCVNGECTTETDDGTTFKCICQKKWAGIKCNLPQPEVSCGDKTIDVFIDKRIVTEQGLPASSEFIHFLDAPGCLAEEKNGGFHLKVNAPFRECGMIITHNGNDYTFYQQIVWNRASEVVERPLILLDFKCTYEDKYTVSFGEVKPFTTTVDLKTSYGVFKVDMNLYKSSSFDEEERYGARPVVTVEDKVCVSNELKNVMPKDLVLTNRECWASTKQDGSGDSHYLVHGKCKDDPTTDMLSNGEGDLARFCFQMFKWKETMEEVYMHCVVNVCNATAHGEYCVCEEGERRRRSVAPIKDGARLTFGPVYIKPEGWDENPFNNEIILANDKFFPNPDDGANGSKGRDSKTTILIAVGIVVVIALISLAIVVVVYINCRRRSRDPKSQLRNDGNHVVIPNPANHEAAIN